jgi:ectoine hydroxylase-related dioxygenase (phytanoyl-CoA dioxygenase family)
MVNIKITKQEVDKYDKLGWIVLKNVFDTKSIKSFKHNIFSFLKNNHQKYEGRHVNYFGTKKAYKEISSFHRLQENNKIKKISISGLIPKIAKKFLKKKLELRASEIFIKKKGYGKATPIHQDAYYWNVKNNEGLTLWVALTASNKKNGSVFYYDKSHKHGVFDHTSSFVKGSSQKLLNKKKLKKFKKSIPNISKGDVVVHNSLVLHGSFKNMTPKKRIGWTFAYKPFNCPYDKKRTKKYERKLFSQISKNLKQI